MNMGLVDQWSLQGRKIIEESQMRGGYEYNRYADRGRRLLLSPPAPLENLPLSYKRPRPLPKTMGCLLFYPKPCEKTT